MVYAVELQKCHSPGIIALQNKFIAVPPWLFKTSFWNVVQIHSEIEIFVLPLVNEGGWYVPNGLMVLAPAAFFVIGIFIWVVRSYKPEQVEEDFSVGALFESGHEVHLR